MKQLETDVVIIGSGSAGLAAAVTAAESDASVAIFEKAATTGGISRMAAGLFAVESKLQRQKMLALTRDEAFKIHMDYTHWRVDARMVRAFIDKSASTIDWLEKLGIEMSDLRNHNPGSNYTWHVIKVPDGSPEERKNEALSMVKTMTRRAQDLGVEIFLRTSAKQIIKEQGQVVGVVAEEKSGETIKVNAKAVIIATGGFGGNPEWVKKHTGFELGRNITTERFPGIVGDGIRMALEAGACAEEMNMALNVGIVGASPLLPSIVPRTFCQPENLSVNLLGERFIDETVMTENPTFGGNAVARQKNGCAFTIFDEATTKYWEENGLTWLPTPKIRNFNVEFKQVYGDGNEYVFAADSLEELASKTGVNLNGLRKTINEYNHACDTGHDEIFAKQAQYLKPIKKPKFYAAKICPIGYGTVGGIKINYKTEVLTKEWDTIPGLYAAGNDANGLYGDSYVFVLPGNMLGFAINSGRMAGENAARYAIEKRANG